MRKILSLLDHLSRIELSGSFPFPYERTVTKKSVNADTLDTVEGAKSDATHEMGGVVLAFCEEPRLQQVTATEPIAVTPIDHPHIFSTPPSGI